MRKARQSGGVPPFASPPSPRPASGSSAAPSGSRPSRYQVPSACASAAGSTRLASGPGAPAGSSLRARDGGPARWSPRCPSPVNLQRPHPEFLEALAQGRKRDDSYHAAVGQEPPQDGIPSPHLKDPGRPVVAFPDSLRLRPSWQGRRAGPGAVGSWLDLPSTLSSQGQGSRSGDICLTFSLYFS